MKLFRFSITPLHCLKRFIRCSKKCERHLLYQSFFLCVLNLLLYEMKCFSDSCVRFGTDTTLLRCSCCRQHKMRKTNASPVWRVNRKMANKNFSSSLSAYRRRKEGNFRFMDICHYHLALYKRRFILCKSTHKCIQNSHCVHFESTYTNTNTLNAAD